MKGEKMKIAVYGGGNVGTQFAAHASGKGHLVYIFTSRPNEFSNSVMAVDGAGKVICGGKVHATCDPGEAFLGANLVFITVPAFLAIDAAKTVLPFAQTGMLIGLIPGTGGMECAFDAVRARGAILFGLQRVPSVARLVKYGQKVCATGYRQRLSLAARPLCETHHCCSVVSDIFDIHCDPLPNYLNVTMTPSNPILHTTRLYVLFKDYAEGKSYQHVPLFYEEWNDESSALLLECDDEVQRICNNLKEIDLSAVRSLKEHYESGTIEALTTKIRNIASFRGLTSPTKKIGGEGFIPNLSSRYFIADFPFGLALLIQIAQISGTPTPTMERVYAWYEKIVGMHTKFSYGEFNINNREEFLRFYLH